MDQQKSIHLFLKGAEAWNQWARRLLKRKRMLMAKGLWQVTAEFDWETGYSRTIGLNEESQNWLERARVDFSDLEFIAGDSVSNKTKARHRLDKTFTAEKYIPTKGINIDFRGFIFPGDAVFSHSDFNGITLFNDTVFHETAWFNNALFLEELWFLRASFKGSASFHQVNFESFTTYEGATFYQGANFESLKAERSFDLTSTTFKNEVPDFIDANFEQPPRLTNIAILPAPQKHIISPRIRNVLSNTKNARKLFRKLILKDLVLTEWLHAQISHKYSVFFNSRRKSEDEPRFRALRKMALKAGDHRNARAFYASLVKSRRHLADKPTHFPGGLIRYLYGTIYELTANFGRSLTRPALASLIVFYAFSMVYLTTAKISPFEMCGIDPHQTTYQAAKDLAYHNALLHTAEDKQQSISNALTCLNVATTAQKKNAPKSWWSAKNNAARKDQSRLVERHEMVSPLSDDELYTASIDTDAMEEANPLILTALAKENAVIPYRITNLSIVQMGLHLMLMSLFLYAIRNHIRMK